MNTLVRIALPLTLASVLASPVVMVHAAGKHETTIGVTVDDSIITAKIKAAMLSDDQIKALDVSVETRKGVVQLSGWVDTPAQIEKAGRIAAGVAGVVSVDNQLKVKA